MSQRFLPPARNSALPDLSKIPVDPLQRSIEGHNRQVEQVNRQLQQPRIPDQQIRDDARQALKDARQRSSLNRSNGGGTGTINGGDPTTRPNTFDPKNRQLQRAPIQQKPEIKLAEPRTKFQTVPQLQPKDPVIERLEREAANRRRQLDIQSAKQAEELQRTRNNNDFQRLKRKIESDKIKNLSGQKELERRADELRRWKDKQRNLRQAEEQARKLEEQLRKGLSKQPRSPGLPLPKVPGERLPMPQVPLPKGLPKVSKIPFPRKFPKLPGILEFVPDLLFPDNGNPAGEDALMDQINQTRKRPKLGRELPLDPLFVAAPRGYYIRISGYSSNNAERFIFHQFDAYVMDGFETKYPTGEQGSPRYQISFMRWVDFRGSNVDTGIGWFWVDTLQITLDKKPARQVGQIPYWGTGELPDLIFPAGFPELTYHPNDPTKPNHPGIKVKPRIKPTPTSDPSPLQWKPLDQPDSPWLPWDDPSRPNDPYAVPDDIPLGLPQAPANIPTGTFDQPLVVTSENDNFGDSSARDGGGGCENCMVCRYDPSPIIRKVQELDTKLKERHDTEVKPKFAEVLQKVEDKANFIGAKISALAVWLKLPLILNVMTFVSVVHNAAMLSRGVIDTVGDLMSNALYILGIKDVDGTPIDVNQYVGTGFKDILKFILGETVYNNLNENWKTANRIYQASAQVVATVRSMQNSMKEILEWTAENTGKIGNALRRDGVVRESAYGWMSENYRSPSGRWERMVKGIEGVDNAASSLNQVAAETRSFQDEVTELRQQSYELGAILETSKVANKQDTAKYLTKATDTQGNIVTDSSGAPTLNSIGTLIKNIETQEGVSFDGP